MRFSSIYRNETIKSLKINLIDSIHCYYTTSLLFKYKINNKTQALYNENVQKSKFEAILNK